MYNRNIYLIKRIKKHSEIKKYLKAFCISSLVVGVLIFMFYGLRAKEQVMRFVTNNNRAKLEKIMTNPRIKFEYSDNEFYDIKANKAVYKDENNILLHDVSAKGDIGNIRAGQLLVTNNGNDLYFSDNPVLVITQEKTNSTRNK